MNRIESMHSEIQKAKKSRRRWILAMAVAQILVVIGIGFVAYKVVVYVGNTGLEEVLLRIWEGPNNQ